MATTTTSVLAPPVQQSFSYKLLAVAVPSMIHKIPAVLKKMPAKGGNTLRMRRYNPLKTAKVPLGNSGLPVPAQELTATDIDAKVDFYGTYIKINEQVTLQAQDPVLNEAAKRLGVSLRQTEDELTRDMLASTATFIDSVGGSNGDTPTNVSVSDVADITKTLLGNDAKTILDQIEGQDKFGTGPIRNSFFALCHTDLSSELEALGGFKHTSEYPSPMNALRSEWGSVGSLCFLISSIGSISKNASTLGADVYNIFCVGMEAYATVEQDEYSAEFIYRPPIYDGPLAQNCSVGYKFAEVPRILNDLWVINWRCTKA